MTRLATEMQRCKVILLLRATLDAGGNMTAAAHAMGTHRNTVQRTLKAAGYSAKELRYMARVQRRAAMKKPPASVDVENGDMKAGCAVRAAGPHGGSAAAPHSGLLREPPLGRLSARVIGGF